MNGIGKTDVGLVRSNNEDAILISNTPIGYLPNLYIVADGMGGHNAGEVASQNSIKFFCEFVKTRPCNYNEFMDYIIEAVLYANEKVYKMSLSHQEMNGMGTTFSVCVFYAERVFIAHIGDSRIYIIGGGRIVQLTSDHTYVNEMIRAGEITVEEAKVHPHRNLITRVLGVDEGIFVDARVDNVYLGDKILICSDGLSNMIPEDLIFQIITHNADIEARAVQLIEAAKSAGGIDNISVVLIDI